MKEYVIVDFLRGIYCLGKDGLDAFRMSLNSNVFIPLGIPVTERARLLGHSVETNEKYYSYARKNSIQDICALLNGQAV